MLDADHVNSRQFSTIANNDFTRLVSKLRYLWNGPVGHWCGICGHRVSTWCHSAPLCITRSNLLSSSRDYSWYIYCYRHTILNLLHPRMKLHVSVLFSCVRSNEVWVLDLEQWSWSKPPVAGPSPHPRGGQSQVRQNKLHCCSQCECGDFRKSRCVTWTQLNKQEITRLDFDPFRS